MKDSTTFGLSPEKLASLLGIGTTTQDDDHLTEELLKARLSGTLPLDSDVVAAIPAILGRLTKDLLPLGGKPLGDALLDPGTDLEMLKNIKNYAKKLAASEESGPEHAAGIAIYYSAIASSILFHGEKITQHSWLSLVDSFGLLLEKPWLPLELSRHLAKAGKFCQGREHTP